MSFKTQAQHIIHLWKIEEYESLKKEISQISSLEALHLGREIFSEPDSEKFYQWLEEQLLLNQVNHLFIDNSLASKKIDNRPALCKDCSFHRVIPDPDLNDNFNYDDEAMVCLKMKNTNQDTHDTWVANRQEYAIITSACRPYETLKEGKRPGWCPLPL
jgi:hypothetical protein